METIKQYRVIHLASFTKISTIVDFDSEDKQAEQSSASQIEYRTEKSNQPDPLGRGTLHSKYDKYLSTTNTRRIHAVRCSGAQKGGEAKGRPSFEEGNWLFHKISDYHDNLTLHRD